MAMHWTEVKDEIERELDAIWLDEPVEVTLSKKGYFPGRAGAAHGNYFGNLFFQVSELQGLGPYIVEPMMYQALADDSFDVEHIKKMFIFTYYRKCKLLGDEDPDGAPAAWFNVPKAWRFYNHVVESFDTIDNKKDLKDLLWSWFGYLTRMYRWFHTVFPWEVCGQLMPCITSVQEAEELVALAKRGDEVLHAGL